MQETKRDSFRTTIQVPFTGEGVRGRRATRTDRAAAKAIHSRLETYRVPANMLKETWIDAFIFTHCYISVT